jgi:hypothetical protein
MGRHTRLEVKHCIFTRVAITAILPMNLNKLALPKFRRRNHGGRTITSGLEDAITIVTTTLVTMAKLKYNENEST